MQPLTNKASSMATTRELAGQDQIRSIGNKKGLLHTFPGSILHRYQASKVKDRESRLTESWKLGWNLNILTFSEPVKTNKSAPKTTAHSSPLLGIIGLVTSACAAARGLHCKSPPFAVAILDVLPWGENLSPLWSGRI